MDSVLQKQFELQVGDKIVPFFLHRLDGGLACAAAHAVTIQDIRTVSARDIERYKEDFNIDLDPASRECIGVREGSPYKPIEAILACDAVRVDYADALGRALMRAARETNKLESSFHFLRPLYEETRPAPSEAVWWKKVFALGEAYKAYALLKADAPLDGRQAACARAKAIFGAFCFPEQGQPHALFYLGMLSYYQAVWALQHPETRLSQEEKLVAAFQSFNEAGLYFEVAAAQPDKKNLLIPARAKDCLAHLCEQGVLGEGKKDVARAFSLRLAAAHEGFAEAQINLADMYRAGEGTPFSLSEAGRWLAAAQVNAWQLRPQDQAFLKQQIVLNTADLQAQADGPGPDRSVPRPSWGRSSRDLH